jgi:hypothetical protein
MLNELIEDVVDAEVQDVKPHAYHASTTHFGSE